MSLGVVGVVVVPEAPDDLAPGAAEDACGVRVAGASGAGAVVDVGRPRVVTAACVGRACRTLDVVGGQHAHRNLACFGFARLDRDGGLAGVGGQRPVGRVAVAAVADLGEHRRGAQPRVWGDEQRAERLPVGMRLQRVADLDRQLADPRNDRLQR